MNEKMNGGISTMRGIFCRLSFQKGGITAETIAAQGFDGGIFSVDTRQKNFPLLYGRGKFFIQLFPPVMGSCSPPTDVKMRRPVYDLGYHESFDCNNFLGIYSKTSRSYSCLQRKLPLQELVETLVHLRSQFCEHGLHHQRLHHIEQQRKSYTHPQMCRTNIL